jgi:DNA polymerase-3 subunit beta
LGLIQGIVERRNTMPILSHVLIQADKSVCILSATDLEVGINVSCQAQVAEKGKAAVPGRKLYEIVKELPSGKNIQLKRREKIFGSNSNV